MRFAYADPPYLGCAVKFYGDHPEAAVYDTLDGHRKLIDRLVAEFPDGWAYSLTSSSLQAILPLCPDDVRIGAWVKPFHVYKKGVRPAYAWEPLIYRGGRQVAVAPPKGGQAVTPKDFVAANITMKKGTIGAKPPEFCYWLFELMGLDPTTDTLVDIFPGSGAVGFAWNRWCGLPVADELSLWDEDVVAWRGVS